VRLKDEGLQIFVPIAHAAADFDEGWAPAAVAAALQRFHRHPEQGDGVGFSRLPCPPF